MTHTDYAHWMQTALDNALPLEQQRQLMTHVAQCPACGAQWAALVQATQQLRRQPLVQPGAGFQQRFQAQLRARHARPQLQWRAVVLGLGAVLLAALIVPFGLGWLGLVSRAIQHPSTLVALMSSAQAVRTAAAATSDAAFELARNGLPWVISGVALGLFMAGLLAAAVSMGYTLWRWAQR